MRSLVVVAVLSLLPVLGASGARADELANIRKAGVLRVATSLSVEPYNYTDASMQPAGSDVDTAKLLAQDLGVKLELVSTTVPARLPTLQSGKADLVISVLAITPERKEAIDFSTPYSVNSNVLIAPKAVSIASYADLGFGLITSS
ncbi:transporter substrate-binding domain-containing protein [Acidisphaera sp. L21]|uniref:transporter substrate-binding domain-containing protein n=1 Tax=Acidisphaera sp. L21 TaxID=1641851 RepID=UPI00131CD4E5|nr:transporter substrate-binding domain-containing protein [Acidisphaera sp. L21]